MFRGELAKSPFNKDKKTMAFQDPFPRVFLVKYPKEFIQKFQRKKKVIRGIPVGTFVRNRCF